MVAFLNCILYWLLKSFCFGEGFRMKWFNPQTLHQNPVAEPQQLLFQNL